MANIKDYTVDVLPAGEIKEVLMIASTGKHWSDVRKRAFERLHEIIKESSGILFNGDFRTYGLPTKGASAVFRVPKTQKQNLAAYRGQLVLIICVDYAEKWPGYSGRKLAALPISDKGEIHPAMRNIEESKPE